VITKAIAEQRQGWGKRCPTRLHRCKLPDLSLYHRQAASEASESLAVFQRESVSLLEDQNRSIGKSNNLVR